jgi:hypothetical protein
VKKIFKILIIIILLSQLSIQQSNAVFGLSKCDKIIKSVNQEQSIGLINWRTFDKSRDKIILKSKISLWDGATLSRLQILVYESDIKISNILNKNTGCFNPEVIARNQQGVSNANTSYQILKNNLKNYTSYSQQEQLELVTSEQNVKYWNTTYQAFADWNTGKILS